MSGGGASLPANPAPAFNVPNQGQAASGALSGIGNLNTNPNQSYNAGASTQGGSALTQASTATLPYANQILQQGFDPQQALYSQQFAQNQNETNAANAMSGVASTPYGAFLNQQSNQNFDLNWQNQQLQRESTAAGGASTLLGGAGSGLSTGTSVGQSVPGFSNTQLQQAISDYLSYIGAGTGATQAATSQYGTEANAAIANQQLNNQTFAGLGQLGGQLGSAALLGSLI
jgi:hypothetical protein